MLGFKVTASSSPTKSKAQLG